MNYMRNCVNNRIFTKPFEKCGSCDDDWERRKFLVNNNVDDVENFEMFLVDKLEENVILKKYTYIIYNQTSLR